MRTVIIAAVALAAAGAGDAQQRMVMPGPGAAYPMPDHGPMRPPIRPVAARSGQHWGGRVNGVWVGASRAPGGYAAYRRPSRGYVLPSYWSRPDFFISDWSLYGLQQPPSGYRWARYYDDAVLVDGRGSVTDTVGGLDWDRYDLDYTVGDTDRGYDDNRYAGGGTDYPPPPRPYPPERRSNGVGGALVGGALGAGAGALIAGRHDKVSGALVGAGAGALTGYAIDRAATRGRDVPPPPMRYGGPGADYPPPGSYGDLGYRGPRYDGPRPYDRYPAPTVIQDAGGTTVVTTTGGGASSVYGGSYYYPSAGTATVTVTSAPVVTTTTTDIFEDSVTYTRARAHRVYHRRVYRRAPTCGCRVR